MFQCPLCWARDWNGRTLTLSAFPDGCFSALFVGRVIGTGISGLQAGEDVSFSALFVGRVIGTGFGRAAGLGGAVSVPSLLGA